MQPFIFAQSFSFSGVSFLQALSLMFVLLMGHKHACANDCEEVGQRDKKDQSFFVTLLYSILCICVPHFAQ